MYEPKNKVRIVTATSLFDGHDASINIMRRIMQASGAEVIHLGHNRTALDVATAAIEEDAQGVAVTCYQGGHMEFFRYLRKLLDERGGRDVSVFGGGGGTILPDEAGELLAEGTARIFGPDDGRRLGLQGMIDEIIEQCDWQQPAPESLELNVHDARTLARNISAAENEIAQLPAPVVAAAASSETLVVG
ncbi:MAG: methylmalonyl-CoA mutase, partial [Acidimicrobiia bacterium]|nr:methylmalonyl-CoA mutase [Acidimicrobiia bacterium]